jgi:hypothetical protein
VCTTVAVAVAVAAAGALSQFQRQLLVGLTRQGPHMQLGKSYVNGLRVKVIQECNHITVVLSVHDVIVKSLCF